MSGIFIKSITAKGPGVKDSTVIFKRGVNIIHGASNTGKSMIHACIDYILGSSEAPFQISETGYDEVVGKICDSNGGELIVARTILDNDEGSKPCSKINITSSIDEIESGCYSSNHNAKKPYNRILLKLLDINQDVKIVATEEWKLNQLTFRSFVNQFYLNKRSIDKPGSIIFDEYSGPTKMIGILLYLLTDQVFERPTEEDLATKKIKRKAILDYITKVCSQLEEERNNLEEDAESIQEQDLDNDIDILEEQFAKLLDVLKEKEEVARNLTLRITSLEDEVTKNTLLLSRLNDLDSQYDSDLLRLEFIVEGDDIADMQASECPFCHNEIKDDLTIKKYSEASEIELGSLKKRKDGLETELTELEGDIEKQKIELTELAKKRSSIVNEINTQYKPRIDNFHDRISHIKKLAKLQGEIEVKEQMLAALNLDIKDAQASGKDDGRFKVKDYFDDALFNALSDALAKAVKRCNYHNFKSAYLSKKSFDLVVNDKPKASEGSGYSTFLNSLYAFTLMKFLETNGRHPIRLLMLDSPVMALTEPEKYELPDTMLHGLLSYFIEECGDSQIIITENKIPESVDLTNVNIIRFTGLENKGQYGFLEDFRN